LLTSVSVLSNLVAIGVAAGFGCCRGSAERAENRLLPLAAEILDGSASSIGLNEMIQQHDTVF